MKFPVFKHLLCAAAAAVGLTASAATEDGDVVQLAAGTYTGMPTEASYWVGMAGPTDLDGLPRLDRKGRIGLGCFAGVLSGLMLTVR